MSNTQNTGDVILTTETRHFAEIIVNGQSKGKRPINGTPTLKQFAQDLAREFGLKSFNVTVNLGEGSTPVTQKNASVLDRPVTAASAVGVSAKDSRAANLLSLSVD
jgi:hypothetical protein